MLTRKGVRTNSRWTHRSACPGRQLAESLLVLLLVLIPLGLHAADTAAMRISVNGETKGDFLVSLGDDGDVFLRVDDLPLLGIAQRGFAPLVALEDGPSVSLRSASGLVFHLQERTATLELEVPVDLLTGETRTALAPAGAPQAFMPRDLSAFFNYGLAWTAGNLPGTDNLAVAQELGGRWRDVLLLSDAVYVKSDARDSWVRLMSSATYDDRATLRRLVAGDQFTRSLMLGSTLNLGGVGFGKVYAIDPYFIRQPLQTVTGTVSVPSEADIYVNGTRVRSERLSPGTFSITDLAGYAGTNDVEIVLRDAFGRETRVERPFYVSDQLLAKGLHEYGYYAGFLRENLGTESSDYGPAAFTAFHRYGLLPALTVGMSAESGDGVTAGGPEVQFVPRFGIVTAALSLSDHNGAAGAAGLVSYQYQRPDISPHARYRAGTRDYRTVATAGTLQSVRQEANAGAAFRFGSMGSISLDATLIEYHSGEHRRRQALSYARSLTSRAMLHASVVRERAAADSTSIFAGITYNFDQRITGAAHLARSAGRVTEAVQVQKSAPAGEGYGFRLAAERSASDQQRTVSANPSVQYNGPAGIYALNYQLIDDQTQDRQTVYTASAAGAVVYAGRRIGFTRPVRDSFALVKVGEIKDVRVYSNNQEMGRTDEHGELFVPSLAAYQRNQILLADSDIPLDVSFSTTRRSVSPPLRSGSCVAFAVSSRKPITGILLLRTSLGDAPLENVHVDLRSDDSTASFDTGFGGEFYLERIPARTSDGAERTECSTLSAPREEPVTAYHAEIDRAGKRCTFEIAVPRSDDLVIDLGEIIACTDESGPAQPSRDSRSPER